VWLVRSAVAGVLALSLLVAAPPYASAAPSATGRGLAAATLDRYATDAAIQVMQAGGNAVDGAVAASAMIGVTAPYSCGVGGGGFMVIYLAGEQRVVTVDHRETAPRAVTPTLWVTWMDNRSPLRRRSRAACPWAHQGWRGGGNWR